MNKILIVDNNPVVTAFLINRLEKKGYHVLTAEDGLSALGILKTFIPDVIFIDLVMPNISGEKLCQIIRNTPELNSVFIVIISAIAREYEIDFINLGANACIAKGPFNKFSENIFYVLDQLQTKASGDVLNDVIGIDDIYERMITKELLSSRKHLEVILNNNSDGILEITHKAKIVYANPAAISFIGFFETKLLGSNFMELFHQEADRKRIKTLLDKIGDDRQATVADKPVSYDRRQFSLQISPLFDKVNDSFIVIMRDITEIKSAQRALEESQEKYRILYEESKRSEEVYGSLLNSSADAIVIYDLEGKTHYINSTFTDIFGWKLSEVQDKKMPFLPESEKQATLTIVKELVEKGIPCHGFETKRFTKDGRLIDVSISASRYDDHQNKPAGLLVILRDITEKRRLETQLRQAQKMEAIGTLAGGIAHDFNNLMMGMLGNLSLVLNEQEESDPHFERLKKIEENIKSGSELTSQLLGYARKGKYEVKTIDLNEIVKACAETFGRTRKEITIHREICEGLFVIEADKGQVEQALINLFINAGDAMPRGGYLYLKTLNVSEKEMMGKPYCPKAGNYVLIEVTDSGIGMKDETLKRIFDPFFTTKEMGRGTGLGLASVYGIIKAHNGYIDVTSEKGKGTSFNIYLPATEKKVVRTKGTEVEFKEGSGTVLLIDDEEIVLNVAVQMLEKLGYSVLSAKNGWEGIEVYKDNKNKIDLIILDLIMPGLDGEDTFHKIKEINPDAKVLLSSGYGIHGRAQKILERGCNGFIQKPFNLTGLSQKVTAVLDNR